MQFNLHKKVYAYVRQISRDEIFDAVFLYTPFFLFFSSVLLSGVNIQYYSSGAVGGERGSIYASVFNNQIVVFPSISEWIKSIIDPILLIHSCILTVVCFCFRSKRASAVALFLIAVSVMTVSDIVTAAVEGGIVIDKVIVSFMYNCTGFAILSYIYVLLLVLYERIAEHYGYKGKSVWAALAGLSVAAIGIMGSAFIYLLLLYFYQPTSVQIDVSFDPPSRGYLEAELKDSNLNPASGSDLQKSSPGKLVPEYNFGASLTQESFSGQPNLFWKNENKDSKYKINISFYGDCFRLSGKIPSKIVSLSRPISRSLLLKFNGGWTNVFIPKSGETSFTLFNPTSTPFWITQNKDKTIKVASYTSVNSEITALPRHGMTFFANAPFIATGKGRPRRVPRSITIDVDGKTVSRFFPFKEELKTTDKANCHAMKVDLGRLVPADRKDKLSLSIGVRIDIVPVDADIFSDGELASKFVLKNSFGWANIDDLSDEGLAQLAMGRFASVVVWNTKYTLSVDGASVDTKSFRQFQMKGVFDGQYLAGGSLRLIGSARAVWNDNARVNPTRWERLSLEMQLTLLSAMAGILLLVGRITYPVFRRAITSGDVFRME